MVMAGDAGTLPGGMMLTSSAAPRWSSDAVWSVPALGSMPRRERSHPATLFPPEMALPGDHGAGTEEVPVGRPEAWIPPPNLLSASSSSSRVALGGAGERGAPDAAAAVDLARGGDVGGVPVVIGDGASSAAAARCGEGELRGNGRGLIISPSSHHSRCRRRRRADQIHPWSRFRGAGMVSSAEVVIRTTSPDVKVDAMCVTPTGDVLCVGTKMGGRVWHGEIHSTCPSRQPARTNLRRRSHHPRDPKPLTRSSLFLPPSFPQTLHRARASLASRPPARGSPPSPSSPTAPSSPAATRGSSRRGPCPETSSRGPSTSRAAARTPTTLRSPRW